MLNEAPALERLSDSIFAFLDDLPICGHRVDFDISFLDTALFPLTGKHIQNDFFDTLLLSQRLLPELIHHKLGDLAAYYRIDYHGAHRAHRDCEITYECLRAMEKTAKASFSSKEAFYQCWKSGSRKISAADIVSAIPAASFCKEHPFYKKNVAITGILYSLSRREAMLKIANAGGSNQDKVTIFTDFLVKGNGSGTSKEKKPFASLTKGIR